MVERRIVKLNYTPAEAATFSQPGNNIPGVAIVWLNWEKPNVVVAELVATDLAVNPIMRKSEGDLRHEVLTRFKGRVIEDNLKSYYLSPSTIFREWALIDDPMLTGPETPRQVKRAAEEAKEVVDLEITDEQLKYMKSVRPNKREELETIAVETREKPKEVKTSLPDGRQVKKIDGYETVRVFKQGLIDSG